MKTLLLIFILRVLSISDADINVGQEVSECTGSVHLRQNSAKFRVLSEPLIRTRFDKYKKVEVNVMGSCCYKVFQRLKFRGQHKRLESAGKLTLFGKHIQSVARVECLSYRSRGVVRAGGGPVGMALAGLVMVLAVAGVVVRWRRGRKEGGGSQDVEMEALNK